MKFWYWFYLFWGFGCCCLVCVVVRVEKPSSWMQSLLVFTYFLSKLDPWFVEVREALPLFMFLKIRDFNICDWMKIWWFCVGIMKLCVKNWLETCKESILDLLVCVVDVWIDLEKLKSQVMQKNCKKSLLSSFCATHNCLWDKMNIWTFHTKSEIVLY